MSVPGGLKQQIEADVKSALLAGEKDAVQTLRGLKAAILSEEVATGKRDEGLGDGEIEVVIAREVKKRRESIALYEQNDRAELAASEQAEIDVLEQYLPEQLSADEVRAKVEAKIAELGVADVKGMGQVIGPLKAELGTSVDGALLAKLVKESLS